MKYSENTIPNTPGGLKDAISFTRMYACEGKFPDWSGLDFDGAFHRLARGIENLRRRFGDAKADQLVDMLAEAKRQFEDAQTNLGSWLMQDVQEVISDRRPFAYPKDLYRWPIDPSARDVTPQDLSLEDDED